MAESTMITIKRPDGTIEKISLAEFMARKKKKTDVPAASKPAVVVAPVVSAPQKTKPSIQPSESVPKNLRPLNHSNIKSLVSEIVKSKPIEKSATTPKVSVPVVVPPEIKRTEEKKIFVPQKPVVNPPSVSRFEKSDAASLLDEEVPPPATVNKPLIKPMGMPTALMKENENILPSTSAPVNTFVHAPQTMRTMQPRHESALNKEKDITAPPVRPMVRDIFPVKPSNLGPVDEIEFFTLTDFRRLSSNPPEAASRLKQKFLNLRDESYVLFIDGLAAWRQSPLFIEYSGAVTEALNTKKKLSDVLLSDPNKIQMNEIQAIIQMEKDLI